MLKLRGDDDDVFASTRDAGVFIASADDDKAAGYRVLQNLVANADVLIDALFGTSLRLPIKGDAAKVLQAAHKAITLRAERPIPPYTTPADPDPISPGEGPIIIAVDCPSGLDCDTGALDKLALPAHETITFAAAKPGLLTFPGAETVGTLRIADIGLPPRLPELDEVALTLVDAAAVQARLPQRPRDSHKGTFGKAMVVAGSLNYTGAAYLAAAAAYHAGAGLVTVGAPQIIVPVLAGLHGVNVWVACLVALVACMAAGAINAFFVVYLDVSSFVVTLGTGTLLIGLSQWISSSNIVSLNDPVFSELALKQGWSLNEYGLTATGTGDAPGSRLSPGRTKPYKWAKRTAWGRIPFGIVYMPRPVSQTRHTNGPKSQGVIGFQPLRRGGLKSVLIRCAANSARSILGEAILNRLGHGRITA